MLINCNTMNTLASRLKKYKTWSLFGKCRAFYTKKTTFLEEDIYKNEKDAILVNAKTNVITFESSNKARFTPFVS